MAIHRVAIPTNVSWPQLSEEIREVMSITILLFVCAALLEIGGCFAYWTAMRRGGSPFLIALGTASLAAFAIMLTRVDTMFAGRAYAAYGGIYIAASLVWLWRVEGQRPTASDLLGASIAIVGALLIIAFAPKER